MFLLGDLRLDVDECDTGEGKVFCASGVVAVLSQDADFGKHRQACDQVPPTATVYAYDCRHGFAGQRGCGNGRQRRPHAGLTYLSRKNALSIDTKKQKDQRIVFMEMAFSTVPCESVVDLDLPRCGKLYHLGCSPLRFGSPPIPGIFHSLIHPLPHGPAGDSQKTLHRPEKGHRHRIRCRNHLLRRVLRAFGPRSDPKNIRSYQVSVARSFPPHFSFTRTDLLRPSVPFTPFVHPPSRLKHVG